MISGLVDLRNIYPPGVAWSAEPHLDSMNFAGGRADTNQFQVVANVGY